MLLRFLSLGILAAASAMILELIALALAQGKTQDNMSLLFAVLLFPLIEESVKYLFLARGRSTFSASTSGVTIFSTVLFAGLFFGIGFFLPEMLLLRFGETLSDRGNIPILFSILLVHSGTGILLSFASALSVRSKIFVPVLLFLLALLTHGAYNFFLFT